MKPYNLVPAAITVVLAGCATMDGRARSDASGASESLATASSREAVVENHPAVQSIPLDLWADLEFQRRLRDSYLSDTETEPALTKAEGELISQASELLQLGEIDKAYELIDKKRNSASSATLDYWIGNIHLQREAVEEAAVAYEIAVEKFPKFRRAWENLGQTYYRLDNPEKAAFALTRVIEFGGAKAITFGLLGYSYMAVRDFLAAESALRMAALLEPGRKEWKRGLADALYGQKRYPEAITLLESLIVEEPERVNLWLQQGSAYLAINEPMKAAENFEFVEMLGQATADSSLILGNIYATQGIYDLAASAYLRSLAKAEPEAVEKYLNAGKFLAVRGATAEAKGVVDQVAQSFGNALDDKQRRSLLELQARVAEATGADEDQARILNEMIELDPRDGQALLLLAEHYERKGDVQTAINLLERAAGLEDFERQAKIRHGQFLVNQGRPVEALPLLKRAQDLEASDKLADYIRAVEQRASLGK